MQLLKYSLLNAPSFLENLVSDARDDRVVSIRPQANLAGETAKKLQKKRRIIDPHTDCTAFGFVCSSELPSVSVLFRHKAKRRFALFRSHSFQSICAKERRLFPLSKWPSS